VSLSAAATVTAGFTLATVTPPPGGLVAGYAFSGGTGTTVADASGGGNTGTLTGATWTAGKFGSGLSFSGSGAVTVPDAASLDLTTGLTLMGWVYPTARPAGAWMTVVLKEQPGELVYGLYATSDTGPPEGCVNPSTTRCARAGAPLPLNTWTHLAVTYDNATLRLYVNGAQVASRALSGRLPISAGPLKIGGNSVWGEYFRGTIDEVRVYNRALSAVEIATLTGAAIQ
jgi:hypothetical protein